MTKRLNVYSEWWTDPRRFQLAERLGSETLADGAAIQAWKVSQEFWANKRSKIPSYVFHKIPYAEDILAVDLAVETEKLIYVRGSRQFHEWLIESQENGRKGGRPKKNSDNPTETQPPQNEKGNSKPTSLSLSLFSSSLSSSVSNSKKEEEETKGALAPNGIKSPVGYFVANYIKAHQGRFGEKSRPTLTGKVQGQIKRFVSDFPIERAVQMIQVYYQIDEPWFKTKGYDFSTFLANLQKIEIALDTGLDPNDPMNDYDWKKVFGK